jgi:hypothetical protein
MVDAFGISGSHRMHGVMIANGGPIKAGVDAGITRIYDVAPTLLYLLDQPVLNDMDGQVLKDIISEEHFSANPIRFAASSSEEGDEGVEFSQEENDEVIERLKNLGYIG